LLKPRTEILIWLGCLMVLAGCSNHPARDMRAIAPPGIIIPSDTSPDTSYRGLYVAAPDEGCCWTEPKATLTLEKHATARRLALVIDVPNQDPHFNSWFLKHPIGLTISVAGGSQRSCCYSGGVAGVSFELPRELWAQTGPIEIYLRTDPAFTPSIAEPGNQDSRKLGALLMRAFFY
jgi:hypothetical protein